MFKNYFLPWQSNMCCASSFDDHSLHSSAAVVTVGRLQHFIHRNPAFVLGNRVILKMIYTRAVYVARGTASGLFTRRWGRNKQYGGGLLMCYQPVSPGRGGEEETSLPTRLSIMWIQQDRLARARTQKVEVYLAGLALFYAKRRKKKGGGGGREGKKGLLPPENRWVRLLSGPIPHSPPTTRPACQRGPTGAGLTEPRSHWCDGECSVCRRC